MYDKVVILNPKGKERGRRMKMKEIQSCIYRILEILELVGWGGKKGGEDREG